MRCSTHAQEVRMLPATILRPTGAIALVFCASILWGQRRAADADLSAGKALFEKSCTACHGGNAKGGRGPDLTSGRWRWGGSDAEIARNIIQGIPNTEMPAFPIPQREAEQIVAYL